jgi:hypothetical protein
MTEGADSVRLDGSRTQIGGRESGRNRPKMGSKSTKNDRKWARMRVKWGDFRGLKTRI